MERFVPYCSRVVGLLVTVHVLLVTSAVRGEEECLNENGNHKEHCKPCSPKKAQRVYCYECDSRTNARCADPFNHTLSKKELPELEECQGCCVKIVRQKNTQYESVWRTCTKKIQINLFMVDHVCMYENDQRGHMCFCEADKCNGAAAIITRFSSNKMMMMTAVQQQSLLLIGYCAFFLLTPLIVIKLTFG